jgi:hypothetical protein
LIEISIYFTTKKTRPLNTVETCIVKKRSEGCD